MLNTTCQMHHSLNLKQFRFMLMVLLLSVTISETRAATYYSRATGNWNNPSTWSTVTYGGAAASTTPGSAPGDIVFVSGHTVTVTATPALALTSITLNQLGNNAATLLHLNTATVVLTCNAFFMSDNNVNQDMDLEISSSARLQVNGDCAILRSNSNNRDRRIRVYLRNTAIMNVTGMFTWTYFRAGNENTNEIQLENTAQLNVTGDLTATIGSNSGNNNSFNLVTNNNPSLTVGGTCSFIIQNTDDGDNMRVTLGGGILSSTGEMVFSTASSATGNSQMDIQVNGATLASANGLRITDLGGSGTTQLRFNNASTANPASLQVNGNLIIDHMAGGNTTLQTNANTNFTIDGNMPITWTDPANRVLLLDINAGIFRVMGDLTATINGTGGGQRMAIEVDGNGQFLVDNDLTIHQQTGGALRIGVNKNNGTTARLEVGRDFSINASGAAGDVDVEFEESSTLLVGRDLLCNNQPSGGDHLWLYFRDTPNATIGRDLIFTQSSGAAADDDVIVRQWGGTLSVGRHVVFSKAGGDQAYWRQDNNGVATIGGDMRWISTGGGASQLYLENNTRLTISGNLTWDMQAGGDLEIHLNQNNGNDARLRVMGDMLLSHQPAAASMYIRQNQSSQLIVDGALTIDHAAAGGDIAQIRLANAANSLTVGGDLTMRITAGNNASDDLLFDLLGGTVNINGSFIIEHDAGDDALLNISNGGVMTVQQDLVLQNTGGDLVGSSLNNNASRLYVTGDMRLLDSGGGQTTFTQHGSSQSQVLGDVVLQANAGNQTLVNLNGSSVLVLGGSFLRNPSPNRYGRLTMATGATVHYIGSTNTQVLSQNAGDGGDSFTYTRVTINNTCPTYPQLTVEGPCTINTMLTLTNGVVRSTNSDLLNIANGGAASGGNANSFVDGPMKKTGTGGFTFPVGKEGRWARLAMQSNLGGYDATTEFVCEYFPAPSPNNSAAFYGTGIHHVSFREYWDLSRVFDPGNNAACNVRLYWESNTFSDIDNALLSDLRVAHFRSSTTKWENHGGTGTNTGGGTGYITSTTVISNFSPITLASASGSQPLPVELLFFDARPENGEVRLQWATATETDNDHFTVERSTDLLEFEEVVTLAGAGHSQQRIDYETWDRQPRTGLSYYRLKQVDTDGTSSYSNTVAVNIAPTPAQSAFLAYPNPSSDRLTILLTDRVEGVVEALLVDVSGRVVLEQAMNIFGTTLPLDRSAQLPDGAYQVIVSVGGRRLGTTTWIKAGN